MAKSDSDTVVGFLFIAAIFAVIAWFCRDTEMRYRVEYSELSNNHIVVEQEPKTCEWGTAPLGAKNCHFEKVVTEQKDNNGRVLSVVVTWEKKED